jgi:hemerythrin superfamily protein
MDALELLKKDHRKVAELFEQVKATEDEKKHRQLFEQIKGELETHAHIEETVMYPAFEKKEQLKDLVLEAYEEHKQIKTLLREITALSDGSERLDAKLKVMGENVEHHVDEEENEMFPKVKKLYDAEQLEQMGQELEAAKKQFGKASRKQSSSR